MVMSTLCYLNEKYAYYYPSKNQVFGVSVPCSGRKSGIVVITIDIILSQLDVNKLTNTTLLRLVIIISFFRYICVQESFTTGISYLFHFSQTFLVKNCFTLNK